MFRRILVRTDSRAGARPRPAQAQLVVIDPANLYQTVLIAERTWQHYQELRRQYRNHPADVARPRATWRATAFRRSRITTHDPSRWEYGRPWLQGLNSGDATGAAYCRPRSRCSGRRRLPAG